MQAAITENGLEIQDVAQPEPGAGEVLVRVKAAGLNRADLMAHRREHAALLRGASGVASSPVKSPLSGMASRGYPLVTA